MSRIARTIEGRRLRGEDGRVYRACCCEDAAGCEMCSPGIENVTLSFSDHTDCQADTFCQFSPQRCALDVPDWSGPHVIPFYRAYTGGPAGLGACVFARLWGDPIGCWNQPSEDNPIPCCGLPAFLQGIEGMWDAAWLAQIFNELAESETFPFSDQRRNFVVVTFLRLAEDLPHWGIHVRAWFASRWWLPNALDECAFYYWCPGLAWHNETMASVLPLSCATPIVLGQSPLDYAGNSNPACTPAVCRSHIATGGLCTLTMGP